LCASFSSKVSEQIRKQPICHGVWACFAFLGLLVFLGVLDPSAWPPAFMERRAQRAEVIERIHSAGGWEVLRRDCMLLVQTNDQIYWIRWHTNGAPPLPPAVAALQPKEVYFFSPKLLGEHSDEPRIPVVRIKIFGEHSTGGHSRPYFVLEVVTAPSAEGYTPKERPAASGNGHLNYQKVSDGVYEIF